MNVRYEVTATCSSLDIRSRYIDWMKREHADDLLNVEGCEECHVWIVGEMQVRCEYLFKSEDHLNRYITHLAPDLRQKVRALFSEQEVTFVRSQSLLAFVKSRGDLY